MSKGTRVVPVRIPQALIEAVEEALAARNRRMNDDDFTMSDWIRSAIVEKLDKQKRGKGKKGGVIHPSDYRYMATKSAPTLF